jgi:hypothetical protein
VAWARRASALSIPDTARRSPIRPSLSRRSPSSSRPALIVENVDRTPGLRQRIHYGLFERWRAFERRNRKQTRWEIGMEEWV